jgi:hypothetical protein
MEIVCVRTGSARRAFEQPEQAGGHLARVTYARPGMMHCSQ